MASGLDYKYYQYTGDNGNTYSMKVDKAVGENATFGFGAFSASDPVISPKVARVVYGVSGDGNRARRPVGSATADIFTGTATSFDIPVRGSATARTFTVTAHKGEPVWRRAHNPINL